MQLKLGSYQLKVDCFIYEMFYVSRMVTTKEIPRVHFAKGKREWNQSIPPWKMADS